MSACRWIAILILLGTLAHAAPPTKIDRPNTEHGYVSIHYPKGFDTAKAYPVLYWFHGTSGKPNAGIGRATDEYVAVGMSYLKREAVPPGQYGKAHWQESLAVRSELEAAGIKLSRDVVAGMSKGGWAGFYIGEEVPDGPDAIAIFAAGKDPRYKKARPMPKTLSVLVGTGETDPNYPQAQLAVQFFRQGGAKVCYEEWLGEGHTYRPSQRVLDWLHVEALKGRKTGLASYSTGHLMRELKRAEEIADVRIRYLALRELIGHPATPYAGAELRDRLREAGKAATADPTIADWLKRYNELRTLVAREAGFFDSQSFDVDKLGDLVGRFRALTKSTPDPALAARAAYGTLRAEKMLEIYQAQRKVFETPEFQKLEARYRELQELFQKAKGEPGDEVMQELKRIGAELGDLRHKASMGAFRDAEWKPREKSDPTLAAAIKADPEGELRPYLGVGF